MLGDNPEKSKNPLKKAMRRRNAKTVQFSAPTYVEASDVEYSTDEEDAEGDAYNSEGELAEGQVQAQNGQKEGDDETINKGNPSKDSSVDSIQQLGSPVDTGYTILGPQPAPSRTSDELYDLHGESAHFEASKRSDIWPQQQRRMS